MIAWNLACREAGLLLSVAIVAAKIKFREQLAGGNVKLIVSRFAGKSGRR